MLKKVYLEITNVCNLACSFCPGTRRQPRFMSREEFCALVPKLKGYTDYLYFHLMGEPLLHPELGYFLQIAGELGFKVIITTNGSLLREKGALLLAAPALHKVNISLQSFEANGVGELEAYLSACASFADELSERGKTVVLRLWNRQGLDSLNPRIESLLQAAFPGPWETRGQGKKLRDRVWLEPGDKFDWPDLSAEDYGESCFCHGLRDQIGVLCDGTVVPCCLDHEGDVPLGDLFESQLSDILAGERARRIYQGFSGRKAAEELCRRCGYARRFT